MGSPSEIGARGNELMLKHSRKAVADAPKASAGVDGIHDTLATDGTSLEEHKIDAIADATKWALKKVGINIGSDGFIA